VKSSSWVIGFSIAIAAVPLWGQDGRISDRSKTATPEYWRTVAAAALITSADAYTTARYVGHTRNCNVEGWSPWLYGRRASDSRVFAVMTAEVTANSLLGYYLKKRHSRAWFVPLVAMGTAHGLGAVHNATNCPQ